MKDYTTTWNRVSKRLREAYAELPSKLTTTVAPINDADFLSGTEADFLEYLEHNELELAWDTLAELGRQSPPGQAFWLKLAEAADEMNLGNKAARARMESTHHPA